MENNNMITVKGFKMSGKFGEVTLDELTLPCTKEAWDIIGNLADVASDAAEVVGFENDLSDCNEMKVAEEIKAPSTATASAPTPTITGKVKADLAKMPGVDRTRENSYTYEDPTIKVSIEFSHSGYVELNAKSSNRGFCVYINNKPPKRSDIDISYVIETLNLIEDEEFRGYLVNLVKEYVGNID